MRRHLCLAIALLLLTRTEAAVACSYAPGYGPPSDEELFAKASAVFVGHLVRVEAAGTVRVRELLTIPPWWKVKTRPTRASVESLPPIPAVEATFRVVEVLKGEPPTDGKIRAPRWYMCFGPIIMAGRDYVFFLYDDNFVRSGVEGRHLPIGWSTHAEFLEPLRALSKK